MADYFELSRLLNNQRSGMGNPGAASLGYLLGGGGKAREQQIFNSAALNGVRMQDTLAQARMRQQQGIDHDRQMAARRSLENRYRSKGNEDLADMFAGYTNPEQIAMAREALLKSEAMKQAIDLANNPSVDYNHLNALKMATANGPTQFVRNLGDGSYTGNAYVTNPTVALSDIGRAFVGEKGAQANAANAAASQHLAGAALDKARADAVTGKGSAGKPQGLTTELTKAMFSKPVVDQDGNQAKDSQGRPVTQVDTDKLMNFMQFANRPGVSPNQNAALPQYANAYGEQNDAAPPGAIDLGAPTQSKFPSVGNIIDSSSNPIAARFNFNANAQNSAGQRKVVRTGTLNGKKVVQYDDGSTEYAQ